MHDAPTRTTDRGRSPATRIPSRLPRQCCRLLVAAALGAAWLVAGTAVPRAAAAEPSESESLARREADLQRQYLDLERAFLRLADLLAASDPRRAAVLRDAFDRAREAEVGDRLGRIVGLLEAGELVSAGTSQQNAIEQMNALLALMEEGGRDRNLSDTKQEVRAFLGRITKLIARQREVEGSTEAGAETEPLAARQRETADKAADLANDLDRFARRVDETPAAEPQDREGEADEPAALDGDEPGTQNQPHGEAGDGAAQNGEPENGEAEDADAGDRDARDSDSADRPQASNADRQDPAAAGEVAPADDDQEPILGDDEASRSRRTRRLLQAAERRMREAGRRLDEARRTEARDEQQRALEELETARAELEEILRQVREEEVERLLVQLETRIRIMLRGERRILEAADRLAASAAMSDRERALEAARLGREQDGITDEASRAVTLVRDDGSAVAILQAIIQVRDDSAQAGGLFRRGDMSSTTLGIVADIVAGLEELLAAVEKSQRDADNERQQQQPGGGRPADPGEQPLVDQLAELKMLRSLQVRINTRTDRFAQLLGASTDQAEEPALREALRRLADRQQDIAKAARDIVTGRTER